MKKMIMLLMALFVISISIAAPIAPTYTFAPKTFLTKDDAVDYFRAEKTKYENAITETATQATITERPYCMIQYDESIICSVEFKWIPPGRDHYVYEKLDIAEDTTLSEAEDIILGWVTTRASKALKKPEVKYYIVGS